MRVRQSREVLYLVLMHGLLSKIACNIMLSLLIRGFRKALDSSSVLQACTGDGIVIFFKKWMGLMGLCAIYHRSHAIFFCVHLKFMYYSFHGPDVGPVSQLHYLSSERIDCAILKRICHLSTSFTPRVGKMENKWIAKN